jgi:hypothetical protein
MTAIPVLAPGYGQTPVPQALTASDTIAVQQVGRYLIRTSNTTATPLVTTIDDPNSQLPPGATASASWADVVVTTPITTGLRATVIDAARHRDPITGLVTLTNTGFAAGTTVEVHGPF